MDDNEEEEDLLQEDSNESPEQVEDGEERAEDIDIDSDEIEEIQDEEDLLQDDSDESPEQVEDGEERAVDVDIDSDEFQDEEEDSDHPDSDEEDGFFFHVRMQILARIDRDTVSARPSMITYDASLPTTHAYLGSDLKEHSGRTILDNHSFVSLPLMQIPGVVLTPGQTMPLHIFNQRTISMLKAILTQNRTFGMLYDCHDQSGEELETNMGTTAEIISSKEEEDVASGIENMRLKAIGRQRFTVMDKHRTLDGVLMGRVLILEEKVLSEPLLPLRLRSYKGRRVQSITPSYRLAPGVREDVVSFKKRRRKARYHEASLSSIPTFVYEMYDSAILIFYIKSELRSWYEGSMSLDAVPSNAIDFSYWVASKMPLDDKQRIALLKVDTAVQRLRAELNLLRQCTALRCRQCQTHIGNKSDVFSMSLDGPMAAYVNPGGYIHETLTLYKAQNLNLLGKPSKENSWFPGFSWTILQCRTCRSHMGWKFNANKQKYKPQKFWGLTRSALQTDFSDNEFQNFVLQM